MVGPRQQVLLVGGGVTSAAIAALLADSKKVALTCWDKAHRLGGRMTTFSSPTTGRRGQVDLGPQYITVKNEPNALFSQILASGLLQRARTIKIGDQQQETRQQLAATGGSGEVYSDSYPVLTDDNLYEHDIPSDGSDGCIVLKRPDNYVATQGSESIVHWLWRQAGVTPVQQHFLSHLDRDGDQWVAESESARKIQKFDAVVFTMPVPHFLGHKTAQGVLRGDYLETIRSSPALLSSLQSVRYNSVFSLGLFYDSPASLSSLDWSSRYFPASPVLRYMAVDTVRREGSHLGPDTPVSICVQSKRSWAEEHLELTKAEAAPLLLSEVARLVPELAPPDSLRCHKWRFSQAEAPFPGQPGAVVLNASPLLVAAGDGFTYSSLMGCLDSARAAADIVTQRLD